MVHSTRPGAFRPRPRVTYIMQIQIRSQIHRRRGGYFAQGKRRGRADSMYFVLAPRPPASETSG